MTKYQALTGPGTLATGNAADAVDTRGWIVGAFIPASAGPLHTSRVEVKWGRHLAGEERIGWTDHEQRSTICILVFGRFTIRTSRGDAGLAWPGDYAAWGPGVLHSWLADEDSTTLTVRWSPARRRCRRWAPWRCNLQPTSVGGWVLRCVYCGRRDYPGS